MQTVFRLMAAGGLDLALWLHTEEDPSDAEFGIGVARVAALKEERGGDLSNFRTFIVSDGASPSSEQRTKLFALFERPSKASLVTIALSNPIKRSVASVITWLNPAFRTFEPPRVSQAFAHIDVLAHQSSVLDELHKMQALLSPNRTFQQIEKVLGR